MVNMERPTTVVGLFFDWFANRSDNIYFEEAHYILFLNNTLSFAFNILLPCLTDECL